MLGKIIVEECVRKCLPVIAIDLQGDIAALALGAGGGSPSSEQFKARVDAKVWTPGSNVGIPLSSSSIDVNELL